LGAAHYVDTAAGDPAAELQKFGGARIILATAPDSKSMSALFDGLSSQRQIHRGRRQRRCHHGYAHSTYHGPQGAPGLGGRNAMDSEDTMQFSALSGVRPMIEKYPLEKAAEAYDQMISGRARFSVVLTMGAKFVCWRGFPAQVYVGAGALTCPRAQLGGSSRPLRPQIGGPK
jgi:alcohol dehydrogenase, propanol-preferring